MERTAQNRVIFRANTKKEKSSNPYGYWIFQWEAVGFEPTVPEGTTDFESSVKKRTWRNLTEDKTP